MRLYVLSPDLTRYVAEASSIREALSQDAWIGLALAWSDGMPGSDGSAPSPLTVVDRDNPVGPPTPETLAEYAAARRFEIETAGIEIGGMAIRTDRDSQGLIDRAYALSLVDPGAAITFKAVAGPVTIDAATMQYVAIAVGRHVRDAFVREGQALLAIESGAASTPAEVDAILAGTP